MNYSIHPPSPRLAHLLEGLWIQECAGPAEGEEAGPTTVLPSGRVELLFNLGDPFVQIELDGRERPLPRAMIVGQKTGPIRVRATGETNLLIVPFHPWAAAERFGFALDELKDNSVDLREIWGVSAVADLEENLLEATDPETRVGRVQDFIEGRPAPGVRDFLMEEAVRRIHRARPIPGIGILAGSLRLSRRHFIRRFRRAVGLCPKTLARIIRFQRAIGLRRRGIASSRIAALCRYTDQAHLIRDFKAMAGRTPGSINPLAAPSPLMACFNRPDSSHFYNTIYL